jgi:hypothetical protein
MSDGALQIRSFRVVFDLERRIHHVDRFRVPLPYGVPLRSVGYAAAALVAVLIGQGLPIVGSVLMTMDAPVRLALLPIGVSVLLSRLRIDGRPAHVAALAWLRFVVGPTRYVAFRPQLACERAVLTDLTFARGSWFRPRRRPRQPAGRPRVAGRIAGEQRSLGATDQLVL